MTKFYLLSYYPTLAKRLTCCYKSSSRVNKENFEKLKDKLQDEFDIKPVRLASVICVSLAFRSDDACIPPTPPIRAGGRP